MVERLLILKSSGLNDEADKGTMMPRTQSFNTDDDESLPPDDLQQAEDDSPQTSKSNINLLTPLDIQRSLLSFTSPSFDSINDPEGSISDNPTLEKTKKKKQRRPTDQTDILKLRRSNLKKRPWYTKIDFTKPLICLGALVLIYFMWIKRDVWIPRLLTSNTRLRHTIMRNEEKLNERTDLSQTLKTKNSSLSSDEDNIIDDNDKKNNYNNNDQTSPGDNDEDSPTIHNKYSPQKLNLRVRRNKMSFSKDRSTKKRPGSQYQIIDDDDVDDDDDNDDDGVDGNVDVDDDNDGIIIKSIKEKESILPSSIRSSKKHGHRQSGQSHEKKVKGSTNSKTSLILHSHDDIVEQLRKLVKSRDRHQDLLTILTKETGLNKGKLNRFIHGKDYSIITLDVLISFLNSFDSRLLIVSK